MGDANDDNALKNGLGCGTRVSAEDPPLTAPEVHLELHLAPPPPHSVRQPYGSYEGA